MDYTSMEQLLSIPADKYFIRYIERPYYRTKVLNLIKDAHDYIIENSRHIPENERKKEQVLIKDMVKCSIRVLMSYKNVGDLTIDVMQEALAINGLSLEMHPLVIAEHLKTESQYTSTDIADMPVINLTDLLQNKEDGILCISLGKEVIPGYECCLHIRKI